jgi:integrase
MFSAFRACIFWGGFLTQRRSSIIGRLTVAATRWLRAGIDVRKVQAWLGHESLAIRQKYLEPSKETEKQLAKMRLPF